MGGSDGVHEDTDANWSLVFVSQDATKIAGLTHLPPEIAGNDEPRGEHEMSIDRLAEFARETEEAKRRVGMGEDGRQLPRIALVHQAPDLRRRQEREERQSVP